MSDPQHASYSRYIYTRDGRVYGYLFTDSEGNQWGDLLPGRGPISHRHHTGSLHAAAGHHLHHGFAHHHSGHHPHHLRTVAAATDSFAGHRRAIPAEDPDERRIRELAIAINREAGSVGDGRAILEFYALSLAGAVMVLSLPAAGLWLNEQMLGALEGRLFWSGWSQGAMEAAQNYAVGYGGRVIAGSGVGILLDELGQGPIQDFLWGVLSKFWAYGAISSEEDIDAFIYSGGKVWQTVELPILWSADGFTRLLEPAKQIIFHLR